MSAEQVANTCCHLKLNIFDKSGVTPNAVESNDERKTDNYVPGYAEARAGILAARTEIVDALRTLQPKGMSVLTRGTDRAISKLAKLHRTDDELQRMYNKYKGKRVGVERAENAVLAKIREIHAFQGSDPTQHADFAKLCDAYETMNSLSMRAEGALARMIKEAKADVQQIEEPKNAGDTKPELEDGWCDVLAGKPAEEPTLPKRIMAVKLREAEARADAADARADAADARADAAEARADAAEAQSAKLRDVEARADAAEARADAAEASADAAEARADAAEARADAAEARADAAEARADAVEAELAKLRDVEAAPGEAEKMMANLQLACETLAKKMKRVSDRENPWQATMQSLCTEVAGHLKARSMYSGEQGVLDSVYETMAERIVDQNEMEQLHAAYVALWNKSGADRDITWPRPITPQHAKAIVEKVEAGSAKLRDMEAKLQDAEARAEKGNARADAAERNLAKLRDVEAKLESVSARLRSAEAESAKLRDVEARLHGAEAKLQSAEKKLQSAEARADMAEAQLVKTPGGAKADARPTLFDRFDAAIERAMTAEAEVRDMKVKLWSAEGRAKKAETELRIAEARAVWSAEAGAKKAEGELRNVEARAEKAEAELRIAETRAENAEAELAKLREREAKEAEAKAEADVRLARRIPYEQAAALLQPAAKSADTKTIKWNVWSYDDGVDIEKLFSAYKAYKARTKELEDEYDAAKKALENARAEKGEALKNAATGIGESAVLEQKILAMRDAQERLDKMEVEWTKRQHIGSQLCLQLGKYKDAAAMAHEADVAFAAKIRAMGTSSQTDAEYEALWKTYNEANASVEKAKAELAAMLKEADA